MRGKLLHHFHNYSVLPLVKYCMNIQAESVQKFYFHWLDSLRHRLIKKTGFGLNFINL